MHIKNRKFKKVLKIIIFFTSEVFPDLKPFIDFRNGTGTGLRFGAILKESQSSDFGQRKRQSTQNFSNFGCQVIHPDNLPLTACFSTYLDYMTFKY